MTALETKKEQKFKGTVFLGLKAYAVEKFGDEYWLELVERCNFPSPKPLATTWFEGELYRKMLEKISLDINQSIKHTVVDVSKFSVEYDLNGIYKFLMKVSGITTVLEKIPRLSNSYSTASPMSVVLNEKGNYQIQVHSREEFFDFISWCAEGATRAILAQFNLTLSGFEMIHKETVMEEGVLISKGIFKASY